jgi:superfamily I DNA/RNA helicase
MLSVEALVGALNQRFGTGSACDPKDACPGDFIRVTTINAGTGLKSPIVFLVGTNEMFELEKSLRLSEEMIGLVSTP